MLVSGESLKNSMSKYLIDQISETSNIVVKTDVRWWRLGREPSGVFGLCGPEGDETVPASGLFIFIGAAPNTDWLPDTIMRDSNGFVLSGADLKMDGRMPKSWNQPREPVSARNQRAGNFCRR